MTLYSGILISFCGWEKWSQVKAVVDKEVPMKSVGLYKVSFLYKQEVVWLFLQFAKDCYVCEGTDMLTEQSCALL